MLLCELSLLREKRNFKCVSRAEDAIDKALGDGRMQISIGKAYGVAVSIRVDEKYLFWGDATFCLENLSNNIFAANRRREAHITGSREEQLDGGCHGAFRTDIRWRGCHHLRCHHSSLGGLTHR